MPKKKKRNFLREIKKLDQPHIRQSSRHLRTPKSTLSHPSRLMLPTLTEQMSDLEKELNGIKNIYDHDIDRCTPFQKARWLIYEGILGLTETITFNDYLQGNLFSKDIDARKQIRLGGQIFYKEGGMSNKYGMHDTLLWLFIPDAFHSTVNFLWDGVGNWIA